MDAYNSVHSKNKSFLILYEAQKAFEVEVDYIRIKLVLIDH